MRLPDRYLFSLHTIKENKSRSVLTTVISMFLSLLIMGLMCLAISFVNNGNNVLNEVYFNEQSIVSVTYENTYAHQANQEVFRNEQYTKFKETVNNHQEVVSSIIYKTNVVEGGYIFTDNEYPITNGIEIVEGRNIRPSSYANEVIVSQKKYRDSLLYGDPYKVGTTHTEAVRFEFTTATGVHLIRQEEVTFVIVGIFSPTDEKYYFNGEDTSLVNENVNFICDVKFILNANNNIYVPSTELCFKSPSTDLDSKKIFSSLNSLATDLSNNMPKKAVVTVLGRGEYLVDLVDGGKCLAYEQYEQLNKFAYIFIGGGAFVALILLLISVGSLANSVMISIDRSKKFLGLLKALGIRARALRNIVIFESITLISVGILVAYALLWVFNVPLNMINTALCNSMYGAFIEASGYVPRIYIPFYILLASIVLFVALTLLFARGSLRSISKTDPIAVISEVS